jgi:hypothetical protein
LPLLLALLVVAGRGTAREPREGGEPRKGRRGIFRLDPCLTPHCLHVAHEHPVAVYGNETRPHHGGELLLRRPRDLLPPARDLLPAYTRRKSGDFP